MIADIIQRVFLNLDDMKVLFSVSYMDQLRKISYDNKTPANMTAPGGIPRRSVR